MPAHLVALRPGLRWQTTGDEEENSALQFRTVPTELLRLSVCACVCMDALSRSALFVSPQQERNCMFTECKEHAGTWGENVGRCMWMWSVYIRVWASDAKAWYLSASCEPCKCLWMQIDFKQAHFHSKFWASSPELEVRLKNWCYKFTEEEEHAPERESESRSDKSSHPWC